MLKRSVCLVVGSVVVLSVAGIAYGPPVMIRWFNKVAEPNPDADGMAILNYASGQDKTVVQVILNDLLADTQYVVALREPETWTPVTNPETGFVEAVLLYAAPSGSFFFPISAENQETDSKGHLTFHTSTTPGSGDFSHSDVLIILQSDWDAAFPPNPDRPEFPDLRIPVHMIRYKGTPAP